MSIHKTGQVKQAYDNENGSPMLNSNPVK